MNKLAERDKQWEQALKCWETTTHCEQGRYTLQQIEAAVERTYQEGHLKQTPSVIIALLCNRLQPAPKPSLQEQIRTVLQEAHRVSDDFDTTAAEIVTLVRQEIGDTK